MFDSDMFRNVHRMVVVLEDSKYVIKMYNTEAQNIIEQLCDSSVFQSGKNCRIV
jgi:hypothetical protein